MLSKHKTTKQTTDVLLNPAHAIINEPAATNFATSINHFPNSFFIVLCLSVFTILPIS